MEIVKIGDGRAVQAIAPLEAFRRVEPYHPLATSCLAGSLCAAGQAERAMEVLEAALTQLDAFPQDSNLRHVKRLAELYGRVGRWGDVLSLARWAELQPQLCSGSTEERSSCGGGSTQQCARDEQLGAGLRLEGGPGAAGELLAPLELRVGLKEGAPVSSALSLPCCGLLGPVLGHLGMTVTRHLTLSHLLCAAC